MASMIGSLWLLQLRQRQQQAVVGKQQGCCLLVLEAEGC